MSLDWPLFSALIAFLHLCGAFAAAHAIMTVRNSQSAVAWAMSLALIPYFTLIPYILFGRSQLSPRPQLPITRIDSSASVSMVQQNGLCCDLSRFHALFRLSKFPVTANNQVSLLINGAETFDALFGSLAGAQHTIYLQSFTVHHDALGEELHNILCERARAGVKVYFLFDRIGSHKLPRAYIQTLQESGVHTQAFSAGKSFRNPLQINFRNHRKLAIIDQRVAFLGGLNIGMTYLNGHPVLTPWRDTHLQVSGSVIDALMTSFAEDWFWMTHALPKNYSDVQSSKINEAASTITSNEVILSNTLCQVLASGPADTRETCLLFFVEAINSARERIWLASPYFIPDEAVRTALQLAALKGVEVRLLLPSIADHQTVYAASSLYVYDILRAGVKVYRYRPGFMHQKIVLIDDQLAAVGSANLDNRSFRLNFELTLVMFDALFAKQVEVMLEQDFSQSVSISIDEYQQAPAWKKFAMHVAKLFSPIL